MGVKNAYFDLSKFRVDIPYIGKDSAPAPGFFLLDNAYLDTGYLEARQGSGAAMFSPLSLLGVLTSVEVHTGANWDGYNLTGQAASGSLRFRTSEPKALEKLSRKNVEISYAGRLLLKGFIDSIEFSYESSRRYYTARANVLTTNGPIHAKINAGGFYSEYELDRYIAWLDKNNPGAGFGALKLPANAHSLFVLAPAEQGPLTMATVLDYIGGRHFADWWTDENNRAAIEFPSQRAEAFHMTRHFHVIPDFHGQDALKARRRLNVEHSPAIVLPVARSNFSAVSRNYQVSKLSISYPDNDGQSHSKTFRPKSLNPLLEPIEVSAHIGAPSKYDSLNPNTSAFNDPEWRKIIRYYMSPPGISGAKTIKLDHYLGPCFRDHVEILDGREIYRARVAKQHWVFKPHEQKTTLELYDDSNKQKGV